MRFDPLTGFRVSLAIAALAGGWLLAVWLAADDLYDRLGMSMHAVTFLAIFFLISAILVALLFRSFARIKADLAAGRGIVARWVVDRDTWTAFAAPAEEMQRGDKLALLGLIWGFVVIICGGLALAVPRDWHIFAWIGAGIGSIATLAFLAGTRVDRAQLEYRTGEVIIGRSGLLFNGILHVWDTWLSWLEDARYTDAPVAMLTISYAYWARYGPQGLSVRVPVPPGQDELGRQVEAQLRGNAGKPVRRRAPRLKKGAAVAETKGERP